MRVTESAEAASVSSAKTDESERYEMIFRYRQRVNCLSKPIEKFNATSVAAAPEMSAKIEEIAEKLNR